MEAKFYDLLLAANCKLSAKHMFAKLKGLIDTIEDDSVILDVGGVGYHVFCSTRTLAELERGKAAQLVIETHVREDHIHLYGFLSAVEREWFRMLMSVQRVGAKMALNILGAYAPQKLAEIILAKDTRALSKISGVGGKLAERIVLDLKDKVGKVQDSGFRIQDSGNASPLQDDALSALANLGYGRSEAYSAIAKAMSRAAPKSLDQLITQSLKELAA